MFLNLAASTSNVFPRCAACFTGDNPRCRRFAVMACLLRLKPVSSLWFLFVSRNYSRHDYWLKFSSSANENTETRPWDLIYPDIITFLYILSRKRRYGAADDKIIVLSLTLHWTNSTRHFCPDLPLRWGDMESMVAHSFSSDRKPNQ